MTVTSNIALRMDSVIKLVDNCFGNNAKDITDDIRNCPFAFDLLSHYQGKTLEQWEELGVTTFKSDTYDDESNKTVVYTLFQNSECTRINTNNCMGVVRLRDSVNGKTLQIEIGSRFDKGSNKYFLAYLLSKVFGGSIIDAVDMSSDSLWDMLLAFIFRRRLLDVCALGLFKQYRDFDYNDDRLRGRIDVDRHLRRNIPFLGNVAYSTHELTFDNPTNQLIRHALAKVTRKWGGIFTGDNRLTDLRHQLEHSTPKWRSNELLACVQRKENRMPIKHPFFHATFEPLRQISLAILREEGAGLYEKTQEAEGVIFDGSWLWEEYVWSLLKNEPGYEHPDNRTQSGRWTPLDNITMYPDFFHPGKRVVLDAKYQSFASTGDNYKNNVKQIFSYMLVLDALHGGLIYPDAEISSSEFIKHPRQSDENTHHKWHKFGLKPDSEAKTAEYFVASMKMKEEKFLECIRNTIV